MTGGGTGVRLWPLAASVATTAGLVAAVFDMAGTSRFGVRGPWSSALPRARKSISLAMITPARRGGSGGRGAASTFHFRKPGVAGLEGAVIVALDSGDALDVAA